MRTPAISPPKIRRHRSDPAPKTLHVAAENARGRLDQFCRVDQVGCAAWVDVNRCSRFRESPRGPGVIEMNVTEKNVAHIRRVRAGLAESSSHVLESRFRSGIEEGDAVFSLERGRGNDTGVTELFSIKDRDQGRIKKYELRNRRRILSAQHSAQTSLFAAAERALQSALFNHPSYFLLIETM